MKSEKMIATQSFEEGLESLARMLLPEIQKFFDSEEGQRLFKEWESSEDNGGGSGE